MGHRKSVRMTDSAISSLSLSHVITTGNSMMSRPFLALHHLNLALFFSIRWFLNTLLSYKLLHYSRGLTCSENEVSEITMFPTVKKIEKETKEYPFDTVEIGDFSIVK